MVPQNQKNKFSLSGNQLQSHLQSKPRKPMGQNAAQPIGNSGQPNTAGIPVSRAASQYSAGMKKPPSDMGIYGSPGSANRNAAEDKYMNNPGPYGPQTLPYKPDPNANPKDNIQLLNGMPRVPDNTSRMPAPHADANMLYLTKNQEREVFGPMDPPTLTREQEQEILDGKMTDEKWNALRQEQGKAYFDFNQQRNVWPGEGQSKTPPQQFPPIQANPIPAFSQAAVQDAEARKRTPQQPPNINISEMFYGPNSRENALAAQDAAMSYPQADPRLTPKLTATHSPASAGIPDRGFYGLESDVYTVGGKPSKPTSFKPMQAEVDGQSPWKPGVEEATIKRWDESKPVDGFNYRDAYEQSQGGTVGADGLPFGVAKPYNKTPEQAVRDFNTISPERQAKFDADVAKDRAELQKRTEDLNQNLGFTGASIGNQTEYLNKQADIYGQRADSAEAMNKRLDAGGGLQYKQASTGFGTPEEVSQRAGQLNTMASEDKAKQEEYNAEQDKVFGDWKQTKAAKDEYLRETKGIDPDAARKDINRLSSQFAAITKQGVAPGYKFLDFVQDELRTGKVDPGAIKMIEENYNHKFNKYPTEGGQSAPAVSPLNMARAKAKEARDAGYKPGMTQAQRDGLDARRQQAADQAKDRSNVANLIGQGLSPYEARQEVAAANLRNQEVAADQLKQQSALYGQVTRDQLNFNQQKELIEQQKIADRNKQVAAIYQSLGPNAAIAGTPEYAQAQAMIAATQGKTPADPTGGTTPPGGNRTPVQSQAMVNSIANRVPGEVSDIKSPQAPAQIVSFAQRNGLNAKEQVDVLARVTGQPINTKEGGREYIKSLIAIVDKNASEAGKNSAGTFFQSGTKEYLAAHKNAMATQMPVITAIAEANGLTQEDINQMMDTNKYGRAKDYWDSQSGLQAYYPNFWGVANWAMGGGR